MINMIKNAFSSAISKLIVLMVIIVTGSIVDMQLLKARVSNTNKKVDKIEKNATIERKILCKVAFKMQAFDKKDDNLCLDLIR